MRFGQWLFTGMVARLFARLALRRLGGLTNVSDNAAQIAMALTGAIGVIAGTRKSGHWVSALRIVWRCSAAADRSWVCLSRDSSRGCFSASKISIAFIDFHSSC
jgi:hypothetical protein